MSTDYTPSVAEMREYVETGGEPRPWVELDEAEEARERFRGEAFDRMIEAVRAEERERIAASLREKFGVTNRAASWIREQGKEQGS